MAKTKRKDTRTGRKRKKPPRRVREAKDEEVRNPASKARLKGAEEHLTPQLREQLMRAVKGAGSYPVDDEKAKAAIGRLRKRPAFKKYEKDHLLTVRRRFFF